MSGAAIALLRAYAAGDHAALSLAVAALAAALPEEVRALATTA